MLGWRYSALTEGDARAPRHSYRDGPSLGHRSPTRRGIRTSLNLTSLYVNRVRVTTKFFGISQNNKATDPAEGPFGSNRRTSECDSGRADGQGRSEKSEEGLAPSGFFLYCFPSRERPARRGDEVTWDSHHGPLP